MRAAQTLYEGVDIAGHGMMGPVSYTHLDVYKRQLLGVGQHALDGSCVGLINVAGPVSYTHLLLPRTGR